MNHQENKANWIWGAIFLAFAVLLVGVNLWLRWAKISVLDRQIQTETKALEDIKKEETSFFTPELRELFKRYSEGILAVDAILNARNEVFTGGKKGHDEPMVILDMVKFFSALEKILEKHAVVSNFSIDGSGKISFLVQTTSYRAAAEQMKALQDSIPLIKKRGKATVPLLTDVDISSISRQLIVGKAEELPTLLRDSDAVYSFIVQAKVGSKF